MITTVYQVNQYQYYHWFVVCGFVLSLYFAIIVVDDRLLRRVVVEGGGVVSISTSHYHVI